MAGRIAAFLDRDGTINDEVGYCNHVDRFRLLPRSAEAIRVLNEAGILAVVLTNQAGVARGYFPEALIAEVHAKMESELAAAGARLDGIYYCPHHPDVGEPPYRQACNCRKPRTGMLDTAVAALGIDLARSFVVGDRMGDVRLAHKVGAKGILVLTGYGKGEYQWCRTAEPDFVAHDLLDAARWIEAQVRGPVGGSETPPRS